MGLDDGYADETDRPMGLLAQIPLALGVYVLSDNMTLRESWTAVKEETDE